MEGAVGRRAVVSAMLVDSLGSGMLGSFELLYGHVVTGLGLREAGVALSLGTAVAMVGSGPIAGAYVGPGRTGARRDDQGNAASALGCVLLLTARGPLWSGVAAAVLAAGSRAFWASFSAMVAAVAPVSEQRAWFGRIRGVRYVGLTGGQALAGGVLL